MAWYDTWFGSDAYELVYEHRDEDEAQRAIDLVEEAAAPEDGAEVLDVACGRGRHSRELARRGYDVTGVDLSVEAVVEARALAAEEGLDVTFEQGDMRDPVCEACFDGVVNLFTSFGYFEEDEENERAVRAMAEALRPGGWLVQDFLNAPYVIETLVPESTETRNGVRIHQQRWIEDGRVHKQIDLHDGERTQTHRESVRLYTVDDLTELYGRAGLSVQTAYGNYDGTPHSPSTPRLILYARK
jgi:SAM-dependent methyltransferase